MSTSFHLFLLFLLLLSFGSCNLLSSSDKRTGRKKLLLLLSEGRHTQRLLLSLLLLLLVPWTKKEEGAKARGARSLQVLSRKKKKLLCEKEKGARGGCRGALKALPSCCLSSFWHQATQGSSFFHPSLKQTSRKRKLGIMSQISKQGSCRRWFYIRIKWDTIRWNELPKIMRLPVTTISL